MRKGLKMMDLLEYCSFSPEFGFTSADYWAEYEPCIICGNRTNVLRNTPVDLRAFYIKGAGQLCKECFQSLHALDWTS